MKHKNGQAGGLPVFFAKATGTPKTAKKPKSTFSMHFPASP